MILHAQLESALCIQILARVPVDFRWHSKLENKVNDKIALEITEDRAIAAEKKLAAISRLAKRFKSECGNKSTSANHHKMECADRIEAIIKGDDRK